MKGKAPFRVWAGPEGEATGISSTAVARAGLAEAGQAPATSQPQSGRPDPVRSLTVLIHMSMGFMMLALVLCLVLLPTMSLSFRPVFRRLNKADLVFSSLSLSIGFLIVLSLTLFVVNCETLQPRPQVSYLMTTYLCWSGGALMLWAAEHPEVHARTAAVRPRLQVHRGRAPVHFPPQDPPLSLSKQWHPSFSGH
nr:uncharacterized protein LOC116154650 isoform X5 [Camelus dromedarius]